MHIDCSQGVRTEIKEFLKGTETYEDWNDRSGSGNYVVKTREVPFDFNKLIPMPEESETFKAMGNLSQKDHDKYGENTWLAWSREHWGTKWPACNPDEVEETDTSQRKLRTDCQLVYRFDTAWDAPRPIVTELRKRMKDDWGAEVIWFCIHEDGEEEETL